MLGILGAWHGLASVQNAFDVLASTGVAPGLRPYASKNFKLIAEAAKSVHPSRQTIALLLTGAAAAEALAGTALTAAALRGKSGEFGFAVSMMLFGAFFLIDDALDDYDLGADHRAIFTMLAASYAAVRASG
jgi:hypothetical protein